jgi:hypothetical protein
MENSNNKFLEFNGKNIYFIATDGKYWIAIKPICEALGVDYERQRKNIKEDEILCQLPSEQTVVAADGRLRKMICLPEFFIYGWIFSIQSQSKELTKYKMKCYELLYNYFHGSTTGRSESLKVKTKSELELEEAILKMSETPESKKVEELKIKLKQVNKQLRTLDDEFVSSQMELWQSEKEPEKLAEA